MRKEGLDLHNGPFEEENVRQLMEWDAPLLLASKVSSSNNGVRQNILGALRLLLDKQFRE